MPYTKCISRHFFNELKIENVVSCFCFTFKKKCGHIKMNQNTPVLTQLSGAGTAYPSEYLSSPPVFSGVRVIPSLVSYVCFVDHCLSFCTFSFGHCVVCSSSIYGF
jgi:hypothetical protein